MNQKLSEIKSTQEKKGVSLPEVFSGFLIVAGILILLVLLAFVFTTLGASFTAGSAAANLTTTSTSGLVTVAPLVTILLVILAIGAVIAILFASMMFGGRRA